MRECTLLSFAAAACLPTLALASPLVESEPNNTLATADVVGAAELLDSAFAFDGAITLGDVDYIAFDLTLGDFVGATLFHVPMTAHDSLIGLFDPSGLLVASSAALSSLFSVLEFTATATGTWTLAVTGGGDADFDGVGHAEAFDYKLVVGINPVPTPGCLALFAMTGLVGRRRRR